MTLPSPPLRITRVAGLAEAVAARAADPASRFIGGGTDLVPNLRRGIDAPGALIDIGSIRELQDITVDAGGARIGAGVTLAALAGSEALRTHYPAVALAASLVAGPSHRAAATLGGNLCQDTRCVYYNQSAWWRKANGFCLKRDGEVCHVAPQGNRCHAAFSGDVAPALMVHGAEVEIAGAQPRRMPLGDLYVEDGKAHLALGAGELVVAIHLPAAKMRSGYEKVRVRGAIDFPLAGVAVALATEGGRLTGLRVALTGTNSRPFLVSGTDEMIGKPLDASALSKLDKLVQKQVQPMRTTLASANYRRLAAAGLARRLAARLAA